jgi:hypothetical protein
LADVHLVADEQRYIYTTFKPNSVLAGWPKPKAGVSRHAGGQHFWLLLFLFLFVARQKEIKEYASANVKWRGFFHKMQP